MILSTSMTKSSVLNIIGKKSNFVSSLSLPWDQIYNIIIRTKNANICSNDILLLKQHNLLILNISISVKYLVCLLQISLLHYGMQEHSSCVTNLYYSCLYISVDAHAISADPPYRTCTYYHIGWKLPHWLVYCVCK